MYTTASGVKTQFQRLGHGPTLVLLHGWGCDWQIWSPVISELSKEFRLIIPDLPAFGQSEAPPEPWVSEQYVDWLHNFLSAELGSDSFSIVGHSFGGKLAALLAATHPQVGVRKLILVDSSGLPIALSPIKVLQKNMLSLIPESVKGVVPARLKYQFLKMSGSATDHFQSTDQQRLIFKRIYQEDISRQLPKITLPTLIIWGAEDTDTPPAQAVRFQELIPGSDLVILDSAGHFPFIDQPQQCITLIKNFVTHG